MGVNHANYVIFTNHEDTKTIAPNDRRFAFIRTEAEPYPKSFYTAIVDKKTSCLLKPIADQFIKHLLTRDLTNYNPAEAPIFDKLDLYEQRKSKRSAVYRLVDYVFEESKPENGVLIIPDLIVDLDSFLHNVLPSIAEKYGIKEHKDEIDNDIRTELKNKEISTRTISNIIGFVDEDPYVISRCRAKYARDKNVIKRR